MCTCKFAWPKDITPFRQQDLILRGAAIECRVCAEDSLRFLPSPGKITRLHAIRRVVGPKRQRRVPRRRISMFYDNLISKLIVWAPTRAEAIERMSRALSEYQIGGIKTNLGFPPSGDAGTGLPRGSLQHRLHRSAQTDAAFSAAAG